MLLHPSVIERFAAHAPGLSGVTRRTLRTNLRFLARAVVPQLSRRTRRCPASGPRRPIPRRRSTATSRWRTRSRRRRGGCARRAGLPGRRRRADPRRPARRARHRHLPPVRRRHRRPSAAARPRAVPVLARYHEPLLESAAFAGERLITGGTDPARHNITTPLTCVAGRRHRAATAGHLPAARHLAGRLRRTARPGHVPARGRDHLLPAARRHHRHPRPGGEAEAVALLGGQR